MTSVVPVSMMDGMWEDGAEAFMEPEVVVDGVEWTLGVVGGWMSFPSRVTPSIPTCQYAWKGLVLEVL